MSVSFLGLIIVPLLLACLGGIVHLWMRVFRKPHAPHARCGQCGYVVEGLTTMFCPECGSDFRKVGIVKPKKRAVSPVRFTLLWTVLLAPIALVLGSLMVALAPRVANTFCSVYITPVSGSFHLINLHVHGQSRRWFGMMSGPPRTALPPTMVPNGHIASAGQTTTATAMGIDGSPRYITMNPPRPGGRLPSYEFSLNYFPKSQQYIVNNQPVVSGEPSDAVIRDWLVFNGCSPEHPDLLEDAAALQQLIIAIGSRQSEISLSRLNLSANTGGGSFSSSAGRIHPLSVTLVVAFWLLIYAVGIVLYMRHRRRSVHRQQHERDGVEVVRNSGWSSR